MGTLVQRDRNCHSVPHFADVRTVSGHMSPVPCAQRVRPETLPALPSKMKGVASKQLISLEKHALLQESPRRVTHDC